MELKLSKNAAPEVNNLDLKILNVWFKTTDNNTKYYFIEHFSQNKVKIDNN